MSDAPWSTVPVTGAQHAAWMAEERDLTERMKLDTWPAWRDPVGKWHCDERRYLTDAQRRMVDPIFGDDHRMTDDELDAYFDDLRVDDPSLS